MASGLRAFKVAVKYRDEAHPDQIIAVGMNQDIKTIADAEKHCLKHLSHYDRHIHETYECVSAVGVRPEPFPIEQAPMIPAAVQALKANTMESE